MVYEVNVTYNGRNLDTFWIDRDTEELAKEQAMRQVAMNLEYSADFLDAA